MCLFIQLILNDHFNTCFLNIFKKKNRKQEKIIKETAPAWAWTKDPPVNSRMHCHLCYRSLTFSIIILLLLQQCALLCWNVCRTPQPLTVVPSPLLSLPLLAPHKSELVFTTWASALCGMGCYIETPPLLSFFSSIPTRQYCKGSLLWRPHHCCKGEGFCCNSSCNRENILLIFYPKGDVHDSSTACGRWREQVTGLEELSHVVGGRRTYGMGWEVLETKPCWNQARL